MSDKPVPWVVIDSTAINKNDWYLERVAGQTLLNECKARRLHLGVPEVVLTETAASHHRELQLAYSKAEKAHQQLSKLRAQQPAVDKPPESYRHDIEAILTDAGAVVLPIPQTPHEELVSRAARRCRPFDQNGDGYRDALVWFTVLEVAKQRAPVALISNDLTAFAEERGGSGLAAPLVDEVKEAQLPEVALYTTIQKYVETLDPEAARRVVAEWRRRLAGDQAFCLNLSEALLTAARREANEVIATNLGSADVRNLDFVRFSNPRQVNVEDEALLSGEGAMVEVTLIADYALNGEERLAPDQWSASRQVGQIELEFEVDQRDNVLEPRLVGWANLRRRTW